MQRRLARVIAVGLLLGATGAIPAAAAQPADRGTPAATPAARSDVIRVDAVVTDKRGRMVKGLTVDDFVVREDGERQVLTSFEAVDLPSLPSAQAPQAVPTASARSSGNEAGGEPPRRVFLLVMDDGALSTAGAVVAQKAVKRFLAGFARPGDLVSLVVAAAGPTWSARLPEGGAQLASVVDSVKGRRALSPERTSDWDALMAAREGDHMAQALLEEDRGRRLQLFESISAALDAVATVKGRKEVVLFSEGFVQEPDDQPFRDMVAALRRDNAALYFVDVHRLTSGISWRRARPQDSAGAEVAAEETGGLVVRDLEAGFARIAEDASSYYVLGYSSTSRKTDAEYRRISVEVRRADLAVRTRKGYYGGPLPSREESGPDADLAQALADVLPARAIPLRLAAFTLQPVDKRKVRLRLVAEVSLKPLGFEKDSSALSVATLDWTMALSHVEVEGRQRTPWRERKVRVQPQADGLEFWAPLEGSFDMPPGPCQAKVVVRDRASRARGSAVLWFEVPDPAGWRVSTPILSDMPSQERGGPPRMLASRSFASGAPLYCYVEVYPGKENKGAARLSLAYTLVDARGKTKRSQAAAPLDRDASGTPARLERIPLAGLTPGEYELRLAVKDDASGHVQELREPFVVRRPTRPDLATYLELLQAFLAGEVTRASSGVMEWRPEDLGKLVTSLPSEDKTLRRAALLLHTALAMRLWANNRGAEADAQIAICRAVLARGAPPDLHRDWLLALGDYQMVAGLPTPALRALPFFEECARLFPDAAEAWLRAGTCYEIAAFPAGFDLGELPAHEAAAHAERCYREAARLDPRLAEARLRLGRVLGLSGKLDEAERELAIAVEASTEGQLTAFAQVFWGGSRDARGDLDGAVRHYRAALAAEPGSQAAAFALSEALYRAGSRSSASESLASFLSAPRSIDLSDWHAYHLGFGRQEALLATPPEPAPVRAAPETSEAP